ncbi:MAG: error-prone DNA polymerase, partial [Pseudomonadota bacterium]
MFAELSITSNFTFLTGASHAEEYVSRAAELGLSALAVADENSVAGIVRAHAAVRELRREVQERREIETRDGPIGPPAPVPREPDWANVPKFLPAARIALTEGITLTALPRDRAAWGRLCRLISAGRLRAEKGVCDLTVSDVLEWGEGLILLLHAPQPGQDGWLQEARVLARRFGPSLYLLMSPRYDGRDSRRFDRLADTAGKLDIQTVASACPRMHHARRRKLADVLTAIRQGKRVDTLGRDALANGEQRLRSEAEMLRLFRGHEGAVHRSGEIADSLRFSLDQLRYEYPSEISDGESPSERLRRLAEEGMHWRYPTGAPERVRKMIEHELALIAKLQYEPYFLTVRDVVAFARSRDILCQGRGSAANSVVCFCLGITSVSPEIGTMVFERFVSEARNEPPDIDVDFEHERREEVIQHIY